MEYCYSNHAIELIILVCSVYVYLGVLMKLRMVVLMLILIILLSVNCALCPPPYFPSIYSIGIVVSVSRCTNNTDFDYHVVIDVTYPYRNINYSSAVMMFPVRNGSFNVNVYFEGRRVDWEYSGELYDSFLGRIPMIKLEI